MQWDWSPDVGKNKCQWWNSNRRRESHDQFMERADNGRSRLSKAYNQKAAMTILNGAQHVDGIRSTKKTIAADATEDATMNHLNQTASAPTQQVREEQNQVGGSNQRSSMGVGVSKPSL